MRNIFIGLILVFIDFTLSLGNIKIGLIPDFIGYILMIRGLEEMVNESQYFIKAKPFVFGMAIYTAILYVLNLLGLSIPLRGLIFLFGIASSVISLYILYNIVMGIIDMEGKYNTSLYGDKLKSIWSYIVILEVLTYMTFLFIPIANLLSIVLFVVYIIFLVEFNKTKDIYYSIVK